MPVIYPEGGMPGLTLRQKQQRQAMLPIDTFKVQLVPLRPAPKVKINNPEDVVKVVKEMGDYDREVAKVIHLDTKNQVMGVETISVGSLSASIVHPRETVKGAILNNSANVIFIHNHPSGICEASDEDMGVTKALIAAFNQVGITLLDSVIVGKTCYFSFKEHGLMPSPIPQAGVLEVGEPARERFVFPRPGLLRVGTELVRKSDLKTFRIIDIKPVREFGREGLEYAVASVPALGFGGELKYDIRLLQRDFDVIEEEPEPEFMIGEHVIKDVENDQFFLKHLLEGRGTPEIAQMIKRVMDFAAEHKAVDFRQNVAAKINECLGVQGVPMFRTRYVTPYPPGIVLMVCYGSRGRMHGVWFRGAPDEDMRVLASRTDGYRHMLEKYSRYPGETVQTVSIGGAGTRFTGQAVVSEALSSSAIQSFLTSRTVDTSKHSRANPIPSYVIAGAAVPENGYLAGYHITDNTEAVMHMLRYSPTLTEQTTVDDLGSGFYVSGVPEYWRVRSRAKWDFAKNLTRPQRQALVDVILSDPNYKKGGGYLADFEVDYLNRDLKQFVDTGDVNVLASTGNQPYNVNITPEIARKAGVPVPKAPKMVKVKLQGKFIDVTDLYYNPDIEDRARDWAGSLEGRKKLTQWFIAATPKNVVNAWLRSMGYAGAFTKSGMTTNPEMVVWDRQAIVDAKIEEQGQR